jgi:alpha-beta hydrolase superfamily lysophospholipase
VYVLGRIAPRTVLTTLGEDYGRALHHATGGEWDYDLRWKPYAGFPVRAGWLAAIRRGHRRLARGLAVQCPTLLCTSDRTGPDGGEAAVMLSTDTILDVAHMHARAPKLGGTVEVATGSPPTVNSTTKSVPASAPGASSGAFRTLSTEEPGMCSA